MGAAPHAAGRLPRRIGRRAAQAAIRRYAHALRLRAAAETWRRHRDAQPAGSAAREAANARLTALACRADGWEALASGDAVMAREHLAEARWFTRCAAGLNRRSPPLPASFAGEDPPAVSGPEVGR